jgi:alkanesulfonate monooxygenase SsuD/methylene tetrahydromethanopterin reductase-like flavin-dependent oxidoreductase (luciferase family)
MGLWGVSVNDNLPTWSIDDWRQYPATGVSLENDRPDLKCVNYYDPLGTLAFVAGVTEHVMLMSCVLALPLYHPILLAKWAASIDQLSGGRLILGVGIGGSSNAKYANLSSSGLNLADPKIRGELTDEYILAIKKLWTEDVATFNGKYCNFFNIEAYPKCVQTPHVPMWTAGWKIRSCRRAAQQSDGLIPNLASPEEVKWLKTKIKKIAEKVGRSGVDFKILCSTWAFVAKSRDEALTASWKMVEKSVTDRYRVDKSSNRVLIGSARDIIDTIEAFRDAGAYGFELRVIYRNVDDLLKQAKSFAEIQNSFL